MIWRGAIERHGWDVIGQLVGSHTMRGPSVLKCCLVIAVREVLLTSTSASHPSIDCRGQKTCQCEGGVGFQSQLTSILQKDDQAWLYDACGCRDNGLGRLNIILHPQHIHDDASRAQLPRKTSVSTRSPIISIQFYPW